MTNIPANIRTLLDLMHRNADAGACDPRIRAAAVDVTDNNGSELEIIEQLARGLAQQLTYGRDVKPDNSETSPDCAWCGGECLKQFVNRAGEVFCSKNHRTASNRALKRCFGDDVTGECMKSPAYVLRQGQGDADDLAMVAAACFKALGFQVKFRISRTAGRPSFRHVYIVVGVPRSDPEQWVPVDLAAPREHLFNNEVEADERRDV